jgi:hypothetical protein
MRAAEGVVTTREEGWTNSTAVTHIRPRDRRPKLTIINGGGDADRDEDTSGGRDVRGTPPDYAGDLEKALDFPLNPGYYLPDPTINNIEYERLVTQMLSDTSLAAVDSRKMVPLDSVIQGGSLIAGSLAVMSILATLLSGAIIIQPLFAMAILVACTGLYVMTLVKSD